MTFSDLLHESYMSIYQGIMDYRDYCEVQKENTILAMSRLNMIKFSFGTVMVDDNFQGGFERARSIAEFDYNKAIQGIGYCDKSWSDHEKFRNVGQD